MKSKGVKKLTGAVVLATAMTLSGVPLSGSGLAVVPGHAETKQNIQKFDSTVVLESSGVGAMTILGGQAEVALGSALAKDGTTQTIGEFKSMTHLQKSGVGAMTILGGKAEVALGSAVSKK